MADFSSLLGAAGIGGQIGQAIVQLDLDTRKYQAEMKVAQAQTQAGATGMSNSLAAFGGLAKAGLAGAAIATVGFGVVAIKAASDLGEAVNKSNVIFGANAREIEEWAEGGATAFGLSKTAALDAAGGFGAMLQTAGLAVDESANMSKSLVELAGDMASFNNIDPTEALEKLRSGLAGEAEPLRRFGVFLSEAAVQQEAYQSGIAKTGEELTEAEKVQARYNIIFEQTVKQQGDFARTSESVPNQLRTIKAEFINTAAAVGEQLLPVITDLLAAFRDILDAARPLLDFMGDLIGLAAEAVSVLANLATLDFKALESGFTDAATQFEKLVRQFTEGEISAIEYANALARLKEETGVNVELTAGHEAAINQAVDAQRRGRQAASEWEQIMKDQAAAAEDLGDETGSTTRKVLEFANKTGEEIKQWRIDTLDSFESAILVLEDFTTETDITKHDVIAAFRDMEREAQQFSRAMDELAEASKKGWISDEFIEFLSQKGPEWIIAFTRLNKEQQREAQQDWRESSRLLNEDVNGSLNQITTALKDINQQTAHGKVIIEYEYKGFDPTKPGMAGVQRSG